jgi:hypothetical protein
LLSFASSLNIINTFGARYLLFLRFSFPSGVLKIVKHFFFPKLLLLQYLWQITVFK